MSRTRSRSTRLTILASRCHKLYAQTGNLTYIRRLGAIGAALRSAIPDVVATRPDAIKRVDIPDHFVRLCALHRYGQDDSFYAISSTGGLSLGSVCPSVSEERTSKPDGSVPLGGRMPIWRSMTRQEWHLSLWTGLSSDCSYHVRRSTGKDRYRLERFERWVDSVVARLRTAYNLADSDVV